MDKVKIVGIDIAKNVFQLCGTDKRGKHIFNKRVTRNKMKAWIAQLPNNALIIMEACATAHYWSRTFISLGYRVKLISPQFVKPFVQGNKNDTNDARAIVAASLRSDMKYVPIKTVEQQDLQSLHRARSVVIKNRTAYANQIRGLLAEYGIILPQGITHVRTKLISILEDAENELTFAIREVIHDVYEQFKQVDEMSKHIEQKIQRIANTREDCQQLMRLPGVGPMISTAVVAAVGDGRDFKKGREMSAWLGLTPKHRASGDKTHLQGISKRGDRYLRTLVIHGSRSILQRCHNKEDKRSQWISRKMEQIGPNKTAVALANKTIREIWALLRKGNQFSFVN